MEADFHSSQAAINTHRGHSKILTDEIAHIPWQNVEKNLLGMYYA